MSEVQGVMLTRRSVVEEAGAILVPGSEWVPCAWCGVECAASPSSMRLMAAGDPGVCSVCVFASQPVVLGTLAPGATEELALLDRLNGEAGQA